MYDVIESVLRGDVYTLPLFGSPSSDRLPVSLIVNDLPPTSSQSSTPLEEKLAVMGWKGISLHPATPALPDDSSTLAYNSYNLPTMAFHLQPIPDPCGTPSPHLLLISPVSGHLEYEFDGAEDRWRSVERGSGGEGGHSLEGILVRDMLRVFGGCLKM